MNIFITSVFISVRFYPVIDNIKVEGIVSQILYIGPSFHFVIISHYCLQFLSSFFIIS